MSSERIAIVFDGGSGTRMGGRVSKQLLDIIEKPVLSCSLVFEHLQY